MKFANKIKQVIEKNSHEDENHENHEN